MQAQDCYNNIYTKPGAVWLKTKKLKAAFTAGAPSQRQPVGAPTQGTQPGGGTHQPKDGEPHTHINEHGRKEHWCS